MYRPKLHIDKDFWRTDWFIGLAVTLFFLVAAGGNTLQSMERAFYDFTITLTAERPAVDEVTLVAIDEDTVDTLGPWPWSRDVLATALANIAAAEPKAVGFALDLQYAQTATALPPLKQLRELHAQTPAGRLPADFAQRFESLLNDAERMLDGDVALAQQIRAGGNVILGVPYRIRGDSVIPTTRPVIENLARFALALPLPEQPNWLARLLGETGRYDIPVATSFRPPADALAQSAMALGHYQPHMDIDGRVRFERLVIDYQGRYFPALSLGLAAAGLGHTLQAADVRPGEGVMLGQHWLDTDAGLRLMPYYYKRRGDKPAFAVTSFLSAYQHNTPSSSFKDRIVIIGTTHPDLVDPVTIPTGESVPPVHVLANTVVSILNGDYYRVPDWAPSAELLVIMLVALYLVSLLPRIRVGTGLALSAITLVVLANAYVLVMATQGIWLQLITPMMQLLLGHTILGAKRVYQEILTDSRSENAEANRMLALAFQSQGQLDLAFDKFRKCPMDEAMMELLYSLGQDYERKRQFSRAAAVFRYISNHNPAFRDVGKRIMSNNEAAGMQVHPKPGAASSAGTLILKTNGVQKPMLGRYEIDRELGRGAMGMVYLGRDPKIGRTVAIKTVALSQDFDAEHLTEVKERFFREASTAGRLNHPNIVTIYDVGEEHDLAYIAMDYLEGENLTAFTRPDNMMPLGEVFFIIGKIAEALDYAHAHQVVHRDIKPANVVYNRTRRQVTVMDFGVAFLVDANKTKTGTILGTPSYMSPEQLAGSKVDGRSDFFALGVMLFQMVTGELPFIGDSIATLLFKIANEKHPDPRMFRPDLPLCVSRVIDKALRKELDQRFQNGRQFIAALKKCQEIMEKSRSKVTA